MKKLIIIIIFLTLVFSSSLLAAENNSTDNSINIESDQEILEFKKELEDQEKKDNSAIIGSTLYDLNGEKNDIRTQETNLGNLIADAILAETDADLSFINSKGIKASIKKGLISKADVYQVLPARDKIVVKKIKGENLLQAVEHSLSRYPNAEGLFPQLAGMKVIFSKEEGVQNRVLKIMINGQELKMNNYYLAATNVFLAEGGDGFDMFKKAETVVQLGRLDQIFINYLLNHGIVQAKEEGRIIAVEKEKDDYFYQVESGDSLYLIARKFSISIDRIIKLNNIKNKNLIYQGQKLLLPDLSELINKINAK